MTLFAKTNIILGRLIFFIILLLATILAINIMIILVFICINQIEKMGKNPLNIPSPATVNPEDFAKYKAYSNFADRLRNSMDFSQNPCDNFYEYSCGNYEGDDGQFKNLMVVIDQFKNESYMNEEKLPLPVKQAGKLFAKCVEAKIDWDKEVGNGEWLEGKMNKLENLLNVQFPLLHPNSEIHFPNGTHFSAILAHLNNEENLPTFLTISIETNWQNPHSQQQPYILAIDQATLTFQEAYYTRIWEDEKIKNEILEYMILILSTYAEFKGHKLERAKIEEEAKAMLEMENQIGANLNRREYERKEYEKMYNVFTAEEANGISAHLNFEELVRNSVPKNVNMKRVDKFMVMEPSAIGKIMDYIFNSGQVQPRTIFNYFFYRLLFANIQYLPTKDKLTKLPAATNFNLGLPGLPRRTFYFDLESPEQLVMEECANENAELFPWANGRVYLDAKLPTKEERQKLRTNIRSIVAAVLDAFRSMISQLDWMSERTKMTAYDKIDNLIINIGWPELVENDELLAKYYAELQWNDGLTYTQMVNLLQKHQQHILFNQLFLANDTDRSDFGGESPSTVDAWYQPYLNSITFTLGYLETSYDPNFPASVNFGRFGIIAGHELIHGFDDQGIQWDGTGVLTNWMDKDSQNGFDEMAKCVVNQYNQFEPQFEPMKGLTIDGNKTLGENIADSGGIRAAFKAFRTHLALNGPDPRLPDGKLKMLNHDQLFFLSFVEEYCGGGEGDLKKLLFDDHSPTKYHVLGSIQNFPAFRDAFNCPIGTVYGPEKHCEVWETKSKPTK